MLKYLLVTPATLLVLLVLVNELKTKRGRKLFKKMRTIGDLLHELDVFIYATLVKLKRNKCQKNTN